MKKWICVGLILSMLVLPVQAQPEGLSVAGKSALLMDAATGTVLFESNSHEKAGSCQRHQGDDLASHHGGH